MNTRLHVVILIGIGEYIMPIERADVITIIIIVKIVILVFFKVKNTAYIKIVERDKDIPRKIAPEKAITSVIVFNDA